MAGFTLRNLNNNGVGLVSKIQKNLRGLASLGMKWDHELLKQSKSIGVTEAQLDSIYGLYYQQGNYMGMDVGQKEFIAFYDKSYANRRDFLRKFSMNGEIEHVIEIIADETIIYDDQNYFSYPSTKHLKGVLKQDKAKKIVDDLNEAFRKVYFAFGFNQGHDAWHYCKKFLIDGFLAFEIIYDGEGTDDAKQIIGFKELDPISLEPEIRQDFDGKEYRVWIQYRGDTKKQRELLDSNLIYISWARGNFISRISYVERLVRSFNMLRTLENSRIIWNVWNAQMRTKILVPIGTQSEAKARTRLSELRGMYKEELSIDEQSGEVNYNGQVQFPFAKTFIIPTRDGQQTEIDGFQPKGYDLSDTNALNYFWHRFIIETKVPASRFSNDPKQGPSATWGASADGVQREEMRFENFINRIRSILQELILKPTWLQFVLMNPSFSKDQSLRSALGLTFVEDNLFTAAKERSLFEKSATTISQLLAVKQPSINLDGTPGEEIYFDPKFLVEKFMNLTDSETKLNDKYKNQRREELKRLAAAYARINASKPGAASETGGVGGASGGFDFGAGGGAGGGGFEMGGTEGGAPTGGEFDLGLGAETETPAEPEEETTGEE